MADKVFGERRRSSKAGQADSEQESRHRDALRRASSKSSGAQDSCMSEDAKQVLSWLDDDGGAVSPAVLEALGEQEGRQEIAGRFSRDEYRGRRSAAGPERSHSPEYEEGALEWADECDAAYVRQSRPASIESDKHAKKRRKREKRSRRRRKPLTLGKALRNVIILLIVAVAVWLGYLNHNMQIKDEELSDALTGVSVPFQPYYALICGSDTRDDGQSARTDTIILARIDPASGSVTLISIPRDTRVDLGGDVGYSKINAAYSYGGPAGVVNAVSSFAGVPIAHYFEVDFEGLSEIVDAVGGVTVDVPANTTVDDVTLPEGVQTLNGEQALVFVRCRKTYALGDFQRAANQRALLLALADSVHDAPIWRYPIIINAFSKAISTDRNILGMLLMLIELRGVGSEDIMSAMVPSYTETIDGVSYVMTYDDEWAAMMDRVNSGLAPQE